MATRQRTSTYRTYGSVAYAPAYEGNTVRAPQREEVQRPRPKVRPRERVVSRPQIQVRQAGQVSVFAVVGFLAVGVFAALLLLSYVQLTVTSDELVGLRSQLTQLESENATLSAQYEQVFDAEHIQQAVGDTMVRPDQDQVVYIDLSEPDTVTVYESGTAGSALESVLSELFQAVSGVIEYFR